MLCPKCKKEIEDYSLKCEYCGTKLASLCKDCGSFNPITATECSHCGKKLIKICPDCGAANLPDANSCRKCKKLFKNEINEHSIKSGCIKITQQKAKSDLINGIKSNEIKVITLNGESGSGKTFVLKCTIEDLKNANIVWMVGTCTQITQLSPFGYFQNVLLNFFNINNFTIDTMLLKKNSFQFFKQDFASLTNEEISDLLNLLYPEKTDIYENLYFNKAKYFNILKKIITTIVAKTKIIFILDGFEFIDGMSFDFIKELFKDENIASRCKLIILNKDEKYGYGLLNIEKFDTANYLDLNLSQFSQKQVDIYLKQELPKKYNKNFAEKIFKISSGNPAIIEQIIQLYRDIERNQLKEVDFNSLDSLIKLRLHILKQEDINAFQLLCMMSIIGEKFYVAILENSIAKNSQEFQQLVSKLINYGYITQYSTLLYEFRSNLIWQKIVSVIKEDELFDKYLNILFEILSRYKQSSIALLAYITQKLNNNDKSFEIWTLLMKHGSYIGDIGLYIISQKQAYKLIENKAGDFYQKVKKNINLRVGKILEPIEPKMAFEYLQRAMMMLDDNEDLLHIELLAYLASCSMKTGNFCGAIECIDCVLNNTNESSEIEKSLIKSKQVLPLLKLGNYGQLIILIETEILPELEKQLNKGKNSGNYSMDFIFNTWLNIYFYYAEALIFQGDNKSFEIIQNLYNTLEKNHITDVNLTNRTNLLLALANSVIGDVNTSNKILDDILKCSDVNDLEPQYISRWNFIDIINKFISKNYVLLQQELFNVVSYANNTNDLFTKNILKTLLSIMFYDKNETKKALEILDEQVTYFAKEKISTGVLLSWYLIAKIKLETNCIQFSLDIATKALDIAQSSNINNYYFISLLNKLIGEIYMSKQDFESAKVYFEKSLFLAKHFNLQYIQVKNLLIQAKMYQELALPKSKNRNEYIENTIKLYQAVKNIPIVAEQQYLQKEIKSEINIFKSFCKLNNIVLKPQN